MKNALVLALLLLGSVPLEAACVYVRTALLPSSCQAIKEAVVPDPSLPLELAEAPVGPVVSLTCDCEYVLRGANPLCTQERTEQFTAAVPDEPSFPACRRGKILCSSICPKQLP